MVKTLTRKVKRLSVFFHFQSRNVHLQPRNVHFQAANNISRKENSHYALNRLPFDVKYANITY